MMFYIISLNILSHVDHMRRLQHVYHSLMTM